MLVKPEDVLSWSLSDLGSALKKKEISPVETTKMVIDRIDEEDRELNAYISVIEKTVMCEARLAEKSILMGDYKGPLHGIPIAIKDSIDVKGYRSTAGSELYKDYDPNDDAELIKHLKKEGAIIVGKTNMHELGYGTTGTVSYFGPTRHPLNSKKMTGGSSSGSAAAVAGYMAYGAIGSDTGGSIRIPSAFCGIVGMKPTFGSISRRGTLQLDTTLNHVGPMTRTVQDNATLLDTLVEHDPDDPYSVKRNKKSFSESIGKPVKGFTVGVFSNDKTEILQHEIRESFNEVNKELVSHGVRIKEIESDVFEELLDAYRIIAFAEGFAALENKINHQEAKIGTITRDKILEGKKIKAQDYIRALQIKKEAAHYLIHVFHDVDVILTPTTPIMPTEIDQEQININGYDFFVSQVLGWYTCPINVIGFPALSVPGLPKKGLSVGFQLIGKPYSEKTLYRFASFIERLHY